MKSFKKYLTPEEQIKELSLTEKAWQSAKQKIAENKELSPEEQKLIDDFLGIQPEPEPEPIVEEVVEEQVQYQLVTGPQGEQGPQGIPGEKGEKGDQGEKGEQGIPGEKGERGERGLAGLNGLRGEKGDKGDQGIQGERGDVGPQGEQGLPGRDGADGVKGEKGDQGIAGRDGVDGKDGAPGQKGDKGDRGEKGQDGKNGLNGKDGRDGKDGAKGDKGDRGERGEKGDKGDKGEDGKTPDIKPIYEKFNKLSLDINKKVGRIAGDMGALAGGGGSGSYWLNDLGDTDYSGIVNATNNQVLTYDSSLKKWTAKDQGGGAAVGTLQQVTENGNTTTLGITTAAVQLNLTSAVTVSTGQMAWNPEDLTVDVGMANGVTLQLGQEQYIKVKAAEDISDGQTVMFAGADGNHILAARCNTAVAGFRPEWFIGIATQDLVRNGFGYITTFGKVHNINTLAFQEGEILYVDANTVGGLSNTAPTIPRPQITVAAVTKRAGGDGHLMVRPTWESAITISSSIAANTPSYVANSAASYANSAFLKANAAYDFANTITTSTDQWVRDQANAAFLQANTPSYTANSGSSYANSAFIHANAAFAYANTITFTTDPSAGIYANSAYNQANAATILAQAAYDYANTITTSTDQWVRNQANAAFLQANTPSYTANSAASYANSAFLQANTPSYTANSAASYANAAFLQANTPSHVANSASSYANSAFLVANSAFTSANGTIVWNTANAAFIQANTPSYTANSAALYANSAFITANSAGVYANSAFAAANAATATDATQNTNIASAASYANSAFLAANTPSHVANSAASYANAAFTKANTAITTSGGSITGQLNVTFTPATTVNTALAITAANTKGGTGYADVFQLTNSSAGTTNGTKWIRINQTGGLEIINSAYSAMPLHLSDSGDLTISGNTTFNGIMAGYAPNRPGFRVIGGGTTNIDATVSSQTLTSSNWSVDWSQGSYLNGSTGVFTAPLNGLYSVNLTARTQLNNYAGISAIAVVKTTGGTSTNVCYIEWYNNTSANHMGSSTIVKLTAGDTLKVVATTGKVTFDLNDNWAVAFIG